MSRTIIASCGICGNKRKFTEQEWASDMYNRYVCDFCGKLRMYHYIHSINSSKQSIRGDGDE